MENSLKHQTVNSKPLLQLNLLQIAEHTQNLTPLVKTKCHHTESTNQTKGAPVPQNLIIAKYSHTFKVFIQINSGNNSKDDFTPMNTK
jgi:hypothetical protein